jgi:hypothetical protein
MTGGARPSVCGPGRRFDAAGVPVLIEEHDDVDVGEASQVGGELAGLLTAQFEQEYPPGPEEATGPGRDATE